MATSKRVGITFMFTYENESEYGDEMFHTIIEKMQKAVSELRDEHNINGRMGDYCTAVRTSEKGVHLMSLGFLRHDTLPTMINDSLHRQEGFDELFVEMSRSGLQPNKYLRRLDVDVSMFPMFMKKHQYQMQSAASQAVSDYVCKVYMEDIRGRFEDGLLEIETNKEEEL